MDDNKKNNHLSTDKKDLSTQEKQKKQKEVIQLKEIDKDHNILTDHLNGNQPFFLSIRCSAASLDFTDSTLACAKKPER